MNCANELYSWMIQNELYSQIYRTCKIHKCEVCFGSSIQLQNKQLQVAWVWWANNERSVSAAAEECRKNYMQVSAITWGLHGSTWSLHQLCVTYFQWNSFALSAIHLHRWKESPFSESIWFLTKPDFWGLLFTVCHSTSRRIQLAAILQTTLSMIYSIMVC
jgi:hypothetical protein